MADIGGDESSLMMGAFDPSAFNGRDEDLILPGDSLFGFSAAAGIGASETGDDSSSASFQKPSSLCSPPMPFQATATLAPSAPNNSNAGPRGTPIKSTGSTDRDSSARGEGLGEGTAHGCGKRPSLLQVVDAAVGRINRNSGAVAAVVNGSRKRRTRNGTGSSSSNSKVAKGKTKSSLLSSSASSSCVLGTGTGPRPFEYVASSSSNDESDGRKGSSIADGTEIETIPDAATFRGDSSSDRPMRKAVTPIQRREKDSKKPKTRKMVATADDEDAIESITQTTSKRKGESLTVVGGDSSAKESKSGAGGPAEVAAVRGVAESVAKQRSKPKRSTRRKDGGTEGGISALGRDGKVKGGAVAAVAAIESPEVSMPAGMELIPGFEDTIDAHFVKTLLQGSETQAAAPFVDMEEGRGMDGPSPSDEGVNEDDDATSISIGMGDDDEPGAVTTTESLRTACGMPEEEATQKDETLAPAPVMQPPSPTAATALPSASYPQRPLTSREPSAAVSRTLQATPPDGIKSHPRTGSTPTVDEPRAGNKRKLNNGEDREDRPRALAPAMPRPPVLPVAPTLEGKLASDAYSATSGRLTQDRHRGDEGVKQMAETATAGSMPGRNQGPKAAAVLGKPLNLTSSPHGGGQETVRLPGKLVNATPSLANVSRARTPQPSTGLVACAAEGPSVLPSVSSAGSVNPAYDANADGRQLEGTSRITGGAVAGTGNAVVAPSTVPATCSVGASPVPASRPNGQGIFTVRSAACAAIPRVKVATVDVTGPGVGSLPVQVGTQNGFREAEAIVARTSSECVGSTAAAAAAANVQHKTFSLPRKLALRFTPRDHYTEEKVAQRGYNPAQQLKAPLYKLVDAVFKFMAKKWSEVAYGDLNNVRIVFEAGIPAFGFVSDAYVWGASRSNESLIDLVNSLPEATRIRACTEEVLNLTYTFVPGALGPPDVGVLQPAPKLPAASSTWNGPAVRKLPPPAAAKHATPVAAPAAVSIAVAPNTTTYLPEVAVTFKMGASTTALPRLTAERTRAMESEGLLTTKREALEVAAAAAAAAAATFRQKATAAGPTDTAEPGNGHIDMNRVVERTTAAAQLPTAMNSPSQEKTRPIKLPSGQSPATVAAVDASSGTPMPPEVACKGSPRGGETAIQSFVGRAAQGGFLAVMHTAAVASGIGAGQSEQAAGVGAPTAASPSTESAPGKEVLPFEGFVSVPAPPTQMRSHRATVPPRESVPTKDELFSSDKGVQEGAAGGNDSFLLDGSGHGGDAVGSPLMGEETCMALFGGNGAEVELLVDSASCMLNAGKEVEPIASTSASASAAATGLSIVSSQTHAATVATPMPPLAPSSCASSPRHSLQTDRPREAESGLDLETASSAPPPPQTPTLSPPSPPQSVFTLGSSPSLFRLGLSPASSASRDLTPGCVLKKVATETPLQSVAATNTQQHNGVSGSSVSGCSAPPAAVSGDATTVCLIPGAMTTAGEPLRDPSLALNRSLPNPLPSELLSSESTAAVAQTTRIRPLNVPVSRGKFEERTRRNQRSDTCSYSEGPAASCSAGGKELADGSSTLLEKDACCRRSTETRPPSPDAPREASSSVAAAAPLPCASTTPQPLTLGHNSNASRQATSADVHHRPSGSKKRGAPQLESRARKVQVQRQVQTTTAGLHRDGTATAANIDSGNAVDTTTPNVVPPSLAFNARPFAFAAVATPAALAAPAEEADSVVKSSAAKGDGIVSNMAKEAVEGPPNVTESPSPPSPPRLATTPVFRTRSTSTRQSFGTPDVHPGSSGSREHQNTVPSSLSRSLLGNSDNKAALSHNPPGGTRTKVSGGLDVSNLIDPASMAEIQAGYADTWTSFPTSFWEEEMTQQAGNGAAVDDCVGGKEDSPRTGWLGLHSTAGHTCQGLSPLGNNLAAVVAGGGKSDGEGEVGGQTAPEAAPAELEAKAEAKREASAASQCGNASSAAEANETTASRMRGGSRGSRVSSASMSCVAAVAAGGAQLPEETKSLPTLIRLGRNMTKGVTTPPVSIAPTRKTASEATADEGDAMLPSAVVAGTSTTDNRKILGGNVGDGDENRETPVGSTSPKTSTWPSASPSTRRAAASAAAATAAACGNSRSHDSRSKICTDNDADADYDNGNVSSSHTENSSTSVRSATPSTTVCGMATGRVSTVGAGGRPKKRAKKGRITPTLVSPLLAATASTSNPATRVVRATTAVGSKAFSP